MERYHKRVNTWNANQCGKSRENGYESLCLKTERKTRTHAIPLRQRLLPPPPIHYIDIDIQRNDLANLISFQSSAAHSHSRRAFYLYAQ